MNKRDFQFLGMCLAVFFLPVGLFALLNRAAAMETAKIAACGWLIVAVVRVASSAVSGHTLVHVLHRLHCPQPLMLLVFQIVHQVPALRRESLKIAQALRVRNAFSKHGLLAFRCLAALPEIWLLRSLRRADRVAQAMELRGYGRGS